jgi:hypothetical protein
VREYYTTVVNGPILHGATVLKCPRDQQETGLTVSGYLGQKARVTCPCGQQFEPPPPFDAVQLLQTIAGDPRRDFNLSFGELPE